MSQDRDDPPVWYRPPASEPPNDGAVAERSVAAASPRLRESPIYYHDSPAQSQPGTPTAVAEPTASEPVAAAVPAQPVATAPASAPGVGLSRRLSRRNAGIALLIAVAAAIPTFAGAQVFGWFGTRHALTTPARIGTLRLQRGVSVAAAEHSLIEQGWADVGGGAYGGTGFTQLTLLVGRPAPAMSEGGSLAQGLAATLVQDSLVVNPHATVRSVDGGTPFVCGPAAAAGGVVSVCAWTDSDVAGIVIDASGETLTQTRDLTELARGASER